MKKNIMLVIITFVITMVGTSYAAYKLRASEVSFDKNNTDLNSDNVQDILDELTTNILSYGDAEPSDILKGKTALVNGKKITGIMSNNISNMSIDFILDYSDWNSITIPYMPWFKKFTIHGAASTDRGTRSFIITHNNKTITVARGESYTYDFLTNIVIKPLSGNSNSPYGSVEFLVE